MNMSHWLSLFEVMQDGEVKDAYITFHINSIFFIVSYLSRTEEFCLHYNCAQGGATYYRSSPQAAIDKIIEIMEDHS